MARIVVAEDDAHTLRIMVVWLTRHGHEVFEARDGTSALACVRQHRPDVLISDVNMPGLNGVKLVRTCLEELAEPFSVIVFTARCDRHVLQQQLAGERVQVFPKPFSPAMLIEEIDKLTGWTQMEPVA